MLNDKQKAFCREYTKDHNGTQAAIRAGYSKKTANEQASQLLAKLNIQAYLKELEADIQKKHAVTIEDLMNDLLNLKEYGLNEENLTDKEGNELDKRRKVDAKTALDAIDKLGRMIGAYEKDNSQSKPEPFKIIVN